MRESARDDLAYMRSLVSGTGPMQKTIGETFTWAGALYGGQCLLHWLQTLGLVAQQGLIALAVALLPTLIFIVVLTLIIWKDRKTPAGGAASRALGAVFQGAGLANLVMAKHGVDPDQDVVWVQLRQPQNLWTALQTGIVDASMIGSADLHRPRKEGFVDLGIYKDPEARNASSGLTTSDRVLRERPEMVKRMVRALIKGIQFMKAHKPDTVPIMVEFLELPADEAAYQLTVNTCRLFDLVWA